jgi:16S rRNA (guanine966-N2)-methyltransferase
LSHGRCAQACGTLRAMTGKRAAGGRQERTLRIIAGEWRGRKFRFPDAQIRPTPDRVRETLFNWLQARVRGARCLDLYAGSGALGLEALSRGAASVLFVEQQRLVAAALTELLRQWQATGARVVRGEALQILRARQTRDKSPPDQFDLAFLDPPYAGAAGELTAAIVQLGRGWLAPDARIYVEHAKSDPLPAWPAPWQALRTGTAGEVRYHLLANS